MNRYIQCSKAVAIVAVIGAVAGCAMNARNDNHAWKETTGDYVKPARDYVVTNIKPWLAEPVVINAIKAHNVETAKLKDIDINRLDIGWMDRSNKQLIDTTMNNELSTFLKGKKAAGNGIIFEIFVFDNRGLNVGQTDLTQDYNQGDEAKYWRSFQEGPHAVFVDKVGVDKGRNISQVSLTITDPATGTAIGAATVGIDVDKLK